MGSRAGCPNLRSLRPAAERLEELYCPEALTGCFLWLPTAIKSSRGYGMFLLDGQRIYAHRAAWIVAYGPIPEGQIVRHKCDTPRCVNPSHLELGTMADNTNDARLRGRLSRGERHPGTKLTAAQVAEIRASYPGNSHRALALKFGVTHRQIGNILCGKRWRTN